MLTLQVISNQMHMNSAVFYLRVCSISMIWEKIRNRNSRDKRKQEMQRKPTETQALAHGGKIDTN